MAVFTATSITRLYRPHAPATRGVGDAHPGSSSANEIAPSIFKDTVVFSRTNGRSPGTYILRPKRKPTRLFKTTALETDVAETRVIGRYGREVDHPHPRPERRGREDRRAGEDRAARPSPTLTRFNGIWLRARATSATVEQVGVNAHRGLDVLTADRTLPGKVGSLGSYAIPTLYTNAAGVQKIAPKLRFS